MSGVGKKVLRFGVFEADVSSGELRKAGLKLRLQEQPFQVLMLLLERSGEVVTRDEIRRKVWPADTFVDFDHSLNTSINKIRDVLSDSAANPRFIETLARRGYRFLVPVVSVADSATPNQTENPPTAGVPQESASSPTPSSVLSLTRMEDLPVVRRAYVRVLFVLIQVMYLAFYIVALARLPAVQDLLEHAFRGQAWATILVILSASVGIPVRFYLLTAASFDVKDLGRKALRLFPGTLVLDELWALAPFLLAPQIGWGLALASTAALAYVPFAQRTLALMREGAGKSAG